MSRVTVQVDEDHLARMARGPKAGLAELVWNALDADARVVRIAVELSVLGAVERLIVTDDGSGMPPDEAEHDFKALGGSWKKVERLSKKERRQLHGERGQGRFAAFGIGERVLWETVAELDGTRYRTEIRGSIGSRYEFDISEPSETTDETGTTVTITGIGQQASNIIERESMQDDLTAVFALYLESYSSVQVVWRGKTLDPESLQTNKATYEIDSPDALESAVLTVIEWNRPVERALHLCNTAGMSLLSTRPGIQAPGFEFTAYLRWSEFSNHDVYLAELGAEPASTVIDNAKDEMRKHFRVRAELRQRQVVQQWVEQGVYPYTGEPATPVERAERQVFDVVAVTAAPTVNDGEVPSKRLSLRLIREALESNPSSLHEVLEGVLELPADRLEELGALLRQTTLSAIISTSKQIANRLQFLSGLDTLLFDGDNRAQLQERRQLHRILVNETWVFGEEYALTGDDEPLTKVLRKYLAYLDDDIELADQGPVLRHDGTNPIPDLVLSRSSEIAQDRVENLVIELKRPSATIGADEITQIEKYALAVMRDERFNKPNVSWDFWVIGNKLDEFAESRRNQTGLPFGYVQRKENMSIRVKSWSEVLNDARHRLKFVEKSLDYSAVHDEGIAYLREKHAKYLPPAVAGDVPESGQSAPEHGDGTSDEPSDASRPS